MIPKIKQFILDYCHIACFLSNDLSSVLQTTEVSNYNECGGATITLVDHARKSDWF